MSDPRPSAPRGLQIAAVALAAISLRPAVTAVGPVISEIRSDLGLSAAAAGLLTTLPVVAFGLAGFIVPRLLGRFGIEGLILVAMAGISAGIALRWAEPAAALFGGTLVAGLAIGVANVLLPAFVKRSFPARAGLTTGLYTTAMVVSAAAAAGLSVPITEATGDWRFGLGVWLVPAIIAVIAWIGPSRDARRVRGRGERDAAGASRSLLRDRVAWTVTIYFALQALNFYVTIAWLAEILVSRGLSSAEAGAVLAAMQVIGIVATVGAPTLAGRTRSQSWNVALCSASIAVGFLGLLVFSDAATLPWVAVIGFGQGGCFGLALVLFVLRADDPAAAARLSAMGQGIGYLLAAAGPVLAGLVFDASGGWDLVIALLVVFAAVQTLSGYLAGAPGTVDAAERQAPG
ncbi:MFS transporter [Thermoleophilia bacterium SCSIO 60948]|nr:MFS transporter [Thermoleophilia bacterium SCSIO 60948]